MKNFNSHDLSLPAWGPYTKKYAGISHIADSKHGIRFDLSVFPGQYRRKVELPNVLYEGNYHIWEANAKLTYFSTRHELVGQDLVYTDISYGQLEPDAYIIRVDCENRSDDVQNLVLHYMASLHYPTVGSQKITPTEWSCPESAVHIRAIDYLRFERAKPSPTDSLVPDGKRPNELRRAGFTDGSAVRLDAAQNDTAVYSLDLPREYREPVLVLRYQSTSPCVVCITGDGIAARGELPAMVDPGFAVVQLSEYIPTRINEFKLMPLEGSLTLDSLVLCERSQASEIACRVLPEEYVPRVWEAGSDLPLDLSKIDRLPLEHDTVHPEPERNTLILKYPNTDSYYGLFWDFPDYCIRYWQCDELDVSLRYLAHDHVRKSIKLNGGGHYSNVFMRPIPVPPKQRLTIYGLVLCAPSREETADRLRRLIAQHDGFEAKLNELRATASLAAGNPDGDGYSFSQNRMLATTLTNVVYPVYIKRSYIRHNTPGRWWDSLYTWDSGFIGLGLACADLDRALDCLNTYLTEPGDAECAFIHHGSPVPVQFYLFEELFHRTQSRELLAYFYPRLKQYYRFMTGRLGSSTTDKWQSGLLSTWDYFYNSGGWDDYPPQVAVHARHMENVAAGVVTTSHLIRCAKILSLAAEQLGCSDDLALYTTDIDRLTHAIQDYCWDDDAGYFGYLVHDADGKPRELFRHDSGQNYNMGLDGASPMIAGIVTPEQLERLVGHLSSERELWTPIGLSTVDQSAAYYIKDGYWNGAVWMPHQWFFYRALLDYANGELAYRIAKTGLEVWKNEVDQSYNCYEHFIIASGRGAGWHHFSGLSTPVLMWYRSYYLPGTITTGLSGWVTSQSWSGDKRNMSCTIHYTDADRPKTVVIVMPSDREYTVRVNGKPTSSLTRTEGAVEFTVDGEVCDIEVTAV